MASLRTVKKRLYLIATFASLPALRKQDHCHLRQLIRRLARYCHLVVEYHDLVLSELILLQDVFQNLYK